MSSQSRAIDQHDAAVGLKHLDAVARVVEDAAIEALDLLQVRGCGQCLAFRGGARGHLRHQRDATALEAPLHRDGHESQRDRHQEADHGETQRAALGELCLVGALREQRRFRGAHLGAEHAEIVHQALAETCRDPRHRGGGVVVVQLEDVGHFVEPGARERGQPAGACLLRRIVGDERDETAAEGPSVVAGARVRLEERALLGQQEPAMIGFCVAEPRQHPVDRVEHLVRVLDQRGRRREAGVLVDRQSATEQQDGDGHQERPSPRRRGRQVRSVAHLQNSRAEWMEEAEDIRPSVSKRFANRDKIIMAVRKDDHAGAPRAVHSTFSTGLLTYARPQFCRHG